MRILYLIWITNVLYNILIILIIYYLARFADLAVIVATAQAQRNINAIATNASDVLGFSDQEATKTTSEFTTNVSPGL